MAKLPGEFDQTAWDAWVATRPDCIKELCAKLPPDRLYRLKPHNQRVFLVAYSEDGSVRVAVTGEYNFVTFERQVFGINPDDLEECDLPGPNEILGALLTDEKDIDAALDSMRPCAEERCAAGKGEAP